MSRKHDRAAELRAIADGRLMLNVRNGVTVSRSMLAKIADELEAERAVHAETKRERDEARKALAELVELNNSYSPFGGELYQDRIDRAWEAARRVREGGKADD